MTLVVLNMDTSGGRLEPIKYLDIYALASEWAENDGLWLTQTDTRENLIRFAYALYLYNGSLEHNQPVYGQTEKRIGELRFGIERIIEKTKYDEYGSFEDVRKRIIALCEEILADDLKLV